MPDLQNLHSRSCRTFAKIASNVTADQMNLPTPCTEWSVRDLLNHVVSENLWVPDLLAEKTIAEVGSKYDGDVLGDSVQQAVEESCDLADQAIQNPGALGVTTHLSYGDLPGSVYIGHRFVDLVIHGWDLATATGQNADIEPELVDAVTETIAPELEGMQSSGYYGTPQPVDANANPQTKLLASLGRNG